MASTISIQIPASSEVLVRQFLAVIEELNDLALSAPAGTVFDTCESAVVTKGRELNQHLLSDAVARRVKSAEKKGP